jgi:hypothetical protein
MQTRFPDSRRRILRHWAAALAVTALVAGPGACGDADAPGNAEGSTPPLATLIPSPAPPNSAEPNLTAGVDGVYLTWLERRGGDSHALRFSRWDGYAWSAPGQVMEREGLFVNWADFPSMVLLDDGTMAAHWLQKSGAAPYEYDVRMAISRDQGSSWSEDVTPHHRAGVHAEYGFVSLFPVQGAVGVVWLDGRETVHGNPMTLRFTTVAPDGTTGEEILLDRSVCDCCQTSVTEAARGLVVAYRGRTPGQVRDILVTRQIAGEWTEPVAVHDDGWEIPGCPVNGPSVAAHGDRVVVAWFTGADPGDRVLAAVSEDGGASFQDPVRVDDGQGMGRVSVVMIDGATALVTWLERTSAAAEIRVRLITDGKPGPSAALAATEDARASGFPRVARWRDSLLFAWTEPGETPVVRTAVAPLARSVAGGGRGEPSP